MSEETAPRKYYNEGWNAFVHGEPRILPATVDWLDGYDDCREASESAPQKEIG